jgi:hypothetical protein
MLRLRLEPAEMHALAFRVRGERAMSGRL